MPTLITAQTREENLKISVHSHTGCVHAHPHVNTCRSVYCHRTVSSYWVTNSYCWTLEEQQAAADKREETHHTKSGGHSDRQNQVRVDGRFQAWRPFDSSHSSLSRGWSRGRRKQKEEKEETESGLTKTKLGLWSEFSGIADLKPHKPSKLLRVQLFWPMNIRDEPWTKVLLHQDIYLVISEQVSL